MSRTCPRSTIHRIIATLTLCLGITGILKAAGEPSPAPASFVLDDARIFDAAAVGQMTRALIDLQRNTGVSVYVATSSYQESAMIRNHAQELVEQWLNNKPGLILTYNRGNGQSAVVASPDFWRRYLADEVAQLLSNTSHTLNRPGTAPEHRIQEAALQVINRIQQLDATRGMQHAVFKDAERKLAAWLGAIIVLSGLAIWLVSFVRRTVRHK